MSQVAKQTVRKVFEVYIRTTPEKLWNAITDGDLTRQYFFGGILEPRPQAVGDAMSYHDESGAMLTGGEVLEIDPPRRLVQTWIKRWNETPDSDPPSKITWQITQLGETCKLSVEHEHYAGETALVKDTMGGWPIILSGLKTLLETGAPLRIELTQAAAAAADS